MWLGRICLLFCLSCLWKGVARVNVNNVNVGGGTCESCWSLPPSHEWISLASLSVRLSPSSTVTLPLVSPFLLLSYFSSFSFHEKKRDEKTKVGKKERQTLPRWLVPFSFLP
ncbi:hypothetical protein IE53DRAFT_102478 [Violaceomyces palustris]|uniref:Uncharacterized protein n=1 Tax=Violaceomyces palustris TaxID=1673888 RepID=A0ACD0NWU0_9BASI|nr:hypothetical protein IE53DRAFT_102478 [Violaceomyces palustris]